MRNEKMINDLRKKDPFYDTYIKTSEELTKLRHAHAILISMIKSKDLNIKNKVDDSILVDQENSN